jgi:3-deoxy-D-manno-octulosonic-acid transferase
MSRLFYSLFCRLYEFGIRASAPFRDKAAKWVEGRRDWPQKLSAWKSAHQKVLWIHCASLGEFEQGRPMIEAMRTQYADCKILLTFFSPSGYEIRKDYDQADLVMYLPMDGKNNARTFISLVNPAVAIFVKYEFWYYYLSTLRQQGVPTLLVSAAFRRDQPFFRPHGALFREMLACFTTIFVQNEGSKDLLAGIGFPHNVIACGDTRYDRVGEIARKRKSLPVAEEFKGTCRLLVAGSTWPDDEKLLAESLADIPANWKIIMAPHEIGEAHIRDIRNLFADQTILYSDWARGQKDSSKRILLIDNIGMLSSLYAYGEVAYVGGGFARSGIHNILEPAVFGSPVIMGPVYHKFVEAVLLVEAGYAFPIHDRKGFIEILSKLIAEGAQRTELSARLQAFMQAQAGATHTIMAHIAAHKWLQ